MSTSTLDPESANWIEIAEAADILRVSRSTVLYLESELAPRISPRGGCYHTRHYFRPRVLEVAAQRAERARVLAAKQSAARDSAANPSRVNRVSK